MHSFDEDNAHNLMDSAAFKFTHKLLNHPALNLENLARVLPALPPERVSYSKGLLNVADDFEGTFRESSIRENSTGNNSSVKKNPADRGIEEIIENIRVSNSYIMVNRPEADASFAPLQRQLVEDVEFLMRRLGIGKKAIDPQLYLFIASPNSVTPFHIDRYSHF